MLVLTNRIARGSDIADLARHMPDHMGQECHQAKMNTWKLSFSTIILSVLCAKKEAPFVDRCQIAI